MRDDQKTRNGATWNYHRKLIFSTQNTWFYTLNSIQAVHISHIYLYIWLEMLSHQNSCCSWMFIPRLCWENQSCFPPSGCFRNHKIQKSVEYGCIPKRIYIYIHIFHKLCIYICPASISLWKPGPYPGSPPPAASGCQWPERIPWGQSLPPHLSGSNLGKNMEEHWVK